MGVLSTLGEYSLVPGIGGNKQAEAASSAAAAQEASARKANELGQNYYNQAQDMQRNLYGEGRRDIEGYYNRSNEFTQPYRQAGQGALSMYNASLGLDPNMSSKDVISKFQAGPGYQYAVNEALGTLGKSAAARGLSNSGGLAKELTRTAHGLADQEYGNWQNRLAGLSDMGANLSSQSAQNALNTGVNLSNRGVSYGNSAQDLYKSQAQLAAESELAAGQAKAGGIIGESNAESAQKNQMMGLVGAGLGFLGGGPAGAVAGQQILSGGR